MFFKPVNCLCRATVYIESVNPVFSNTMCDASTQTLLMSEDLDAAGVKQVGGQSEREKIMSTPLRVGGNIAVETPVTVVSDEKTDYIDSEKPAPPSILVKNRKRKMKFSVVDGAGVGGLASLGSLTSGANVVNLGGKATAPPKRLRFDITPVKIKSLMPMKKLLQLESKAEAWRELKKRGWSLIGRKKYTAPSAVIGRDEHGVKYIKDGLEGIDYFYSQHDALAYLRAKYTPAKELETVPAESVSGDAAGPRRRNSSTRAYGLLKRSLRQQGLKVVRCDVKK
jgi:hypothetical protein